jgi:hypothetical protein
MNAPYQRLFTRKHALNESRLESAAATPTAAPGEIVLRLDRFALTTNNITYAAFGDAMQYWDFFPTGQDGWGHMPVWGFADVVASTVEGVEVGERFYGYFPIATHIRMQPERVSPRGFYDGAAHRKALVSAYNQYTRVTHDEAYDPALESYQMLYRPRRSCWRISSPTTPSSARGGWCSPARRARPRMAPRSACRTRRA